MKFFTKDDFYGVHIDGTSDFFILVSKCVELANAKLEKEGRVVYGNNKIMLGTTAWHARSTSDTHKAVLINIEPIEPIEPCKHEPQKVKASMLNVYRDDSDMNKYCFRCSCGEKVKPNSFVVVE